MPFSVFKLNKYLNKLLNETKNLTLDYNPILEQASSGSLIAKSLIIYATIALLFGSFFSLMIIFTRPIMISIWDFSIIFLFQKKSHNKGRYRKTVFYDSYKNILGIIF